MTENKIGDFYVFKKAPGTITIVEDSERADIEKIGRGHMDAPTGRMAVYEEADELRIEDLGGRRSIEDLLANEESDSEVDPSIFSEE